jgi:hypothetical protein
VGRESQPGIATATLAVDQAGGHDVSGAPMIILGVILLIIGFVAKIATSGQSASSRS